MATLRSSLVGGLRPARELSTMWLLVRAKDDIEYERPRLSMINGALGGFANRSLQGGPDAS